jgi:subtilisin family serine protease
MQNFSKSIYRLSLAFGCATIACVATVSAAHAQSGLVSVAANRYIITRNPMSSASGTPDSLSYSTSHSNGYFDLVTPKSAPQSAQSVAVQLEKLDLAKVNAHCSEILQDPSVATCEPDILVESTAFPNDARFSEQWGLHDAAQNADIDVEGAWMRGTGTASTLIGVIDSGIHAEHPDLVSNLWSNPADPRDGVDNDGNGYVDDVFGVNTHFGNSNAQDCLGHGTHVAGIIGAKGNNNEGIAGVIWDSSIISANIHYDCGRFSFISAAVAAYNYFYDLKVRGHNIRVLNASFGGYQYSDASYQAIARLNEVGVLLVAAAGNDTKDAASEPFYPAMYDLPNVISVAATGTQLTLTDYSNYGSRVQIAAPGGDSSGGPKAILSTYSPLAEGTKLYASLYGTSMAAPMVSGTIALVASQFPSLSAVQLKDLLLRSAYSIPSLEGKVADARFLNAKGMSELAASMNDSCPDDPGKTAPGVCGCGRADSDSDGDRVLDCQDACPSDRGKTTPGVCGCGIADADANGNGRIDCLDTGISSVIPQTPRIQLTGRSVLVSMAPRTGMSYFLQITITPPRSTRRTASTNYYEVRTSRVLFRKPTRGSRIQVRYAYLVPGSKSDFSYWSYFANFVVRS